MNTFFTKSTLAAFTISLAISLTISTLTTAQAASKDVIVEAIIGGIVDKHKYKHKHKSPKAVYKKQHKSYHAPKHKYHAPQPQAVDYKRAHVNWCFDNYRTYDVRNNSFKDYDGYIKQCYSPYS